MYLPTLPIPIIPIFFSLSDAILLFVDVEKHFLAKWTLGSKLPPAEKKGMRERTQIVLFSVNLNRLISMAAYYWADFPCCEQAEGLVLKKIRTLLKNQLNFLSWYITTRNFSDDRKSSTHEVILEGNQYYFRITSNDPKRYIYLYS